MATDVSRYVNINSTGVQDMANAFINALTPAQIRALNSGITDVKVALYDSYAEQLEQFNIDASFLKSSVNLSTTIDTTTTVNLNNLSALIHLTSRPSEKKPGAIVIDGNGVIGVINSVTGSNAVITTLYVSVIEPMTGATENEDGTSGLVPAPSAGDQDKFLKGDGTWEEVDLSSVESALENHINDLNNPHQVTKAQIGLGNVDNTSDANKPISTATQNALNNITGLIPSTASTTNKLVDKSYVDEQDSVLDQRIDAISGLGRFLSGWNCSTGLATTNPSTSPYTYPNGSFFIVSSVGDTNYRPTGATYTIGVASSVVETGPVKVGDIYKYDGTDWILIPLDVPVIAQFSNTTLGTILGSTSDGKISANLDGTGSVSGWSTLKQDVSDNASDITTLQGQVADKADDNAVVHLAGAETVTGKKTFTGGLATTSVPSANTDAANKKYVDDSITGATLTAGEGITIINKEISTNNIVWRVW